ncbi:conserved hypothetical protein, partial [Ricinus communis]
MFHAGRIGKKTGQHFLVQPQASRIALLAHDARVAHVFQRKIIREQVALGFH